MTFGFVCSDAHFWDQTAMTLKTSNSASLSKHIPQELEAQNNISNNVKFKQTKSPRGWMSNSTPEINYRASQSINNDPS